MIKPQIQKERMDFRTERAIRFYNIYGDELESISQVLKIRLGGLASAYTMENKLPSEAIVVHSRVKSLTSFLRKLEMLDWPMFGHPTEVITDLFGARVVCWFVDDCYGMLDYIQATNQFISVLGAEANTRNSEDTQGFWFVPRIERHAGGGRR